MKKTGLRYFMIFLLLFVLCIPVKANEQKVNDMAGLLTADEEEKLQDGMAEVAEKHQCDVVLVTTDSCRGKSPQDYTDDYYYQSGYGYGDDLDGIILMVSMGERKFHFATRGKAISIFTDYGLERMDELISGDLTAGNYYDAFAKYISLANEFMKEAEKNRPYDVDHKYSEPMAMWLRLCIAFGVGIVAAGIVLLVLFLQLKSVAPNDKAQEYVRSGSFHITRAKDLFLYRTVSRRKIERDNDGPGGSSTHSTSDGGSAGGHTGSF